MVVKQKHSFTSLHFPFTVIFSWLLVFVVNGQRVEVNVGLVVANTTDLSGMSALTTLGIALSDFYAAHPNFTTRLLLHPRSSRTDIIDSASAVLDLIKNVQVEAIIGPETSMEAQFDIRLGEKAHVPIISYSATSPFLSESEYFIQATQVDSAQVKAIASIVQAFGWRQVVPIYVNNEFGGGLIPTLMDELLQRGTRVPYRSAISSSATNDQIEAELNNLKSMSTRVFIVHMDFELGVRLFSMVNKLGMMSKDYVWIITNGLGNLLDLLTPKSIQSMQGVIGVRTYIPRTPELDSFIFRWKRQMVQQNRDIVDPQVTVFELWAYDAVTSLAFAVEQVGGSSFERSDTSSNGSSTDLSTLGVSLVGQKLIHAIQGTSFEGLSGNFTLIDGKLQSSVLEIVNIIGRGENTVGVWTPEDRFLREVANSDDFEDSISKERLGSITWPGDNKDPPKGWLYPLNEKKLKFLVPNIKGFDEFVKVEQVPGSATVIKGYCIDIFNAVMGSLPYPVAYEYVPFKDGNASYDELISEVYYKKCDGVVGDVTITANRSSYVDFTLPYAESGIVMVAPIKDSDKTMDWVFIKPFSWDLWLASLCYFLLFAFVLWIVEHTNPALKEPNETLFYAFSMMVFAHGHKLSNNITKILVIVWLFFILIITQSYTANLASMLTVKQLQPTVTNIDELIKTEQAVGYQEGSFVAEFLREKHIKNLKSYSSDDELHDLLVKGSGNGGVAAAFDELPFIKLLLSKHCSKYMMVPPTYQAEGFGFVFPLGSPLVSDVSRQVLKVREGVQMVEIANKSFGEQQSCSDSSSTASIISSSELRFDSFKELFLIIGSVTVAGLIFFIISFVKDNSEVWRDSSLTYKDRFRKLVDKFLNKTESNNNSPS